jgi:hypothetical protein
MTRLAKTKLTKLLITALNVRSRRHDFAAGCPGGRMTWAISCLAPHDSRKEAQRLLA